MFPNQDKENPLRNSKHVVQNKDVFKSLARTKLPTKYQFHRKFNPFPRNLLLIPALKRQSLPSTHTHTHTHQPSKGFSSKYIHAYFYVFRCGRICITNLYHHFLTSPHTYFNSWSAHFASPCPLCFFYFAKKYILQ